MNPKDYYYNRFRGQFNKWISQSGAHEHPGEGTYISVKDLRPEKLSHIPEEERTLFHCALACTVLIDQVMYTHFKTDYSRFQQLTRYPKIEYGISGVNVKPWHILHQGIGLIGFERFVIFFISDLKDFFKKQKFEKASWEEIRTAMLNDPDVIFGSYGEIFLKILRKN